MKIGSYHILFIPKNPKKTRRLFLSSLTMKLSILVLLFLIPMVLGSVYSNVYFQNRIVELKQEKAEDYQLLQEKEKLLGHMNKLARSIQSTEESLDAMEQLLNFDTQTINAGLGPIDDGAFKKQVSKELSSDFEGIESIMEKKGEIALRSIRSLISDFDHRVADIHDKMREIYDLNEDRILFLDSMPDQLPIDGWITSGFGMRRSPHSKRYKMHYGIDIASPIGTPILAPSGGKVVFAGYKQGYGRKVIIDHGFGIATLYAHASKLYVKTGDVIKKGDSIAAVGSSGSSTGPHLHYEVHIDGIPTNPSRYFTRSDY